MAWPTNKPDSDKFSSDGDSIKDSRPELKTMSDAVNDIVDFIDTTGISNGDVLVYDSATDTIKPGAGGGGGLSSPLTANLETNGNIIGHFSNLDSAGGSLSTGIQFTDQNFINAIATDRYFPDSAGDPVPLDAGSVWFRNFVPNRISSINGQVINNLDYSLIGMYSRGSHDSAGTDEFTTMNLNGGGTGYLLYHANTTVDGVGSGDGAHQIKIDDTDGILIENTYEFDSATLPNAERIRINAMGEVVVSSKIGLKIETPLTTGSVTFKIDRESTTDWGLKLPEQGGVGYMKMTQDDDSAGSPAGDYQFQFFTSVNLDYEWNQITSTGITLEGNKAYFKTGGADVTCNLPTTNIVNGDVIEIVKTDSSTFTLDPQGNNFDGSTSTQTINSGRKVLFYNNAWTTMSVGV
jgi:hypothetical protein